MSASRAKEIISTARKALKESRVQGFKESVKVTGRSGVTITIQCDTDDEYQGVVDVISMNAVYGVDASFNSDNREVTLPVEGMSVGGAKKGVEDLLAKEGALTESVKVEACKENYEGVNREMVDQLQADKGSINRFSDLSGLNLKNFRFEPGNIVILKSDLDTDQGMLKAGQELTVYSVEGDDTLLYDRENEDDIITVSSDALKKNLAGSMKEASVSAVPHVPNRWLLRFVGNSKEEYAELVKAVDVYVPGGRLHDDPDKFVVEAWIPGKTEREALSFAKGFLIHSDIDVLLEAVVGEVEGALKEGTEEPEKTKWVKYNQSTKKYEPSKEGDGIQMFLAYDKKGKGHWVTVPGSKKLKESAERIPEQEEAVVAAFDAWTKKAIKPGKDLDAMLGLPREQKVQRMESARKAMEALIQDYQDKGAREESPENDELYDEYQGHKIEVFDNGDAVEVELDGRSVAEYESGHDLQGAIEEVKRMIDDGEIAFSESREPRRDGTGPHGRGDGPGQGTAACKESVSKEGSVVSINADSEDQLMDIAHMLDMSDLSGDYTIHGDDLIEIDASDLSEHNSSFSLQDVLEIAEKAVADAAAGNDSFKEGSKQFWRAHQKAQDQLYKAKAVVEGLYSRINGGNDLQMDQLDEALRMLNKVKDQAKKFSSKEEVEAAAGYDY